MAMVRDTGAELGLWRACSACSCNSWSSSELIVSPADYDSEARCYEFHGSRATGVAWPNPLLAHGLENEPFIALPVKFRVEATLPWTQIQFPRRDGHDHFVMNQQGLQMRVSVTFAGAVML